MLIEMVLLLLIAAGVFLFVLAPLLRPEKQPVEIEEPVQESNEQSEPALTEHQTAREPS